MFSRTASLGVESLEPREVPAGFTASAAVQADFAQISMDTQTFHNSLAILAPTIQKDQQALATAIKNATAADPNVQSAQATLNADLTMWLAVLKNDVQAYLAATTNSARSVIVQQYLADLNAGGTAIQTDRTAVQTALQADAGVQAAQAQFNSDAATLYAELAVIQADYTQLHKDLGSEAPLRAREDFPNGSVR